MFFRRPSRHAARASVAVLPVRISARDPPTRSSGHGRLRRSREEAVRGKRAGNDRALLHAATGYGAGPRSFRRSIEDGLRSPSASPGWFRVWIAEEQGDIVGHVGLMAWAQPASAHRVRVGVGVLEPYRQRGVATSLFEVAIDWARGQPQLAWLDAEVFAHNEPSLRLFRRLGFVETARIPFVPVRRHAGRRRADVAAPTSG